MSKIKILLSAHTVLMCFVFISTNRDFSPIQHTLIRFYNRDEKCLLRGTNCL